MRRVHGVLVPGLLALASLGALPQSAQAGCKPGLGSDAFYNTCLGTDVLTKLVNKWTGAANTGLGAQALAQDVRGGWNTVVGQAALTANINGMSNTAIGKGAFAANTAGSNNTAVGFSAGGIQTGSFNTSLGSLAATRDTGPDGPRITGDNNIALGYKAGSLWTTGSTNVAIANTGNAADLKTIRIGTPGVQTRAFIAGVAGTGVASASAAVVVDANGQLGTVLSSLRYKQDVHAMGGGSSPLLQLRPVTFHYKRADADGSRPLQYGLIAEEVAQVLPGLVVNNAEGQPETVAYQLLPGLLLNEFQKEHADLVETRARIAALAAHRKARMDAMAVELINLRLEASRLAATCKPCTAQDD